jgi:hypothetical protein
VLSDDGAIGRSASRRFALSMSETKYGHQMEPVCSPRSDIGHMPESKLGQAVNPGALPIGNGPQRTTPLSWVGPARMIVQPTGAMVWRRPIVEEDFRLERSRTSGTLNA